jgi:hypothetical protein
MIRQGGLLHEGLLQHPSRWIEVPWLSGVTRIVVRMSSRFTNVLSHQFVRAALKGGFIQE